MAVGRGTIATPSAKRAVADEPAEMLANLPPTTLLYGDCDYDYLPTTPEAVKRVGEKEFALRSFFVDDATGQKMDRHTRLTVDDSELLLADTSLDMWGLGVVTQLLALRTLLSLVLLPIYEHTVGASDHALA